jgi:Fe-Mn family superoxide dismutase
MVLHEYYFENLTKTHKSPGGPGSSAPFRQAAAASFGSYDIWKTDFMGVGKMRGVGWAMCYQDPVNRGLSNHWITLHEVGNVTGFVPILVMDVWEHAYLLDYKPSERAQYVQAFFANVDWDAVDKRLGAQTAARSAA